MPGASLSLLEREEISHSLIQDPAVPWAAIGRQLGRHPTTVAREVFAGGGRAGYRPAIAQRRAETDLCRPRAVRLASAGPLRERVTSELRRGRSPEAIWADLVAERVADRVCVETIYASLYAGALDVTATNVPAEQTATTSVPPDPARQQTPGIGEHRHPAGSRR